MLPIGTDDEDFRIADILIDRIFALLGLAVLWIVVVVRDDSFLLANKIARSFRAPILTKMCVLWVAWTDLFRNPVSSAELLSTLSTWLIIRI